jgi:putative transposase
MSVIHSTPLYEVNVSSNRTTSSIIAPISLNQAETIEKSQLGSQKSRPRSIFNRATVRDLSFVQIILVVKNKQSQICSKWEEELYQFIKLYIKARGYCAICVNGTQDHVHVLLSIEGIYETANFVKLLKEAASEFINENLMIEEAASFEWHQGYGYHKYHHSKVYEVISSIKNQKNIHQVKDFKQEYHGMLKANTIKHQLDA